jgi:Patatin-like phospholipase
MGARSGFVVTAVLAALAGCTTTDVARLNPVPVVAANFDEEARSLLAAERHLELRGGAGLSPGSADWLRTAIRNSLYVDYYRSRESRYYPSSKRASGAPADGDWPAGLPRRCIALSGGGMRSAAFAMGALDALHAGGWLAEVDVISSSSGGSYANYWLTMALAAGKSRDEIFSGPGSAALVNVRRNAEVLAKPWWIAPSAVAATDWFLSGVGWLATPGIPPSLPMSAQRGLGRLGGPDHFNGYAGTFFYRMVLNRIFGPSGDAMSINAKELRETLATTDAPVPVISTTARVGAFNTCSEDTREGLLDVRSLDLETSVFEFTPWRAGSGGIGYGVSHDPLPFSMAVAASAAAPDDPNAARCPLMGAAELRLGMFNQGYRPVADQVENEHEEPARRGTAYTTLVDAAYSDNLAVFPLVRRLCQEILVIDAEHDPTLEFKSYVYLRQHLRATGIELEIPGIDALAARHLSDCRTAAGGCACRGPICLVESRAACHRYGPENDCEKPFRLPDPVFHGTIHDIPFADHPAAGGNAIRRSLVPEVTYIKLSLDEDRLHTYPSHVRDRFAEQAALRAEGQDVCTGKTFDERCSFPQESTYDQDFSDGQFEAYWDLGHCIAERYLAGRAGAAAPCRDDAWPPLPARANQQ